MARSRGARSGGFTYLLSISADGGKSWRLAVVRDREEPRNDLLGPTLACADYSAGFLAAITTSGSLRWVNPYTACPRDVEFRAVAADSSGAFVVGDTNWYLPGHVNRGGWDAVLFKVDPSGLVQWTKQFGTSNDDAANSVAIGGGDVFVAGDVEGALPGQPFVGARDAFVRTFTGSGVRLWTSEFGAPDGWAIATAVAANSSGIAVGGPVRGTLPGQTYAGGLSDGFVREYSVGGSVIWTREFGTSGTDNVSGVSGRQTIWVVGATDGGFGGAGSGDLFLRRFDLSGNTTDTTQFGTGGTDVAFGISATRRAGFVVGDTNGTWPGQTNAGGSDAFVLKVA